MKLRKVAGDFFSREPSTVTVTNDSSRDLHFELEKRLYEEAELLDDGYIREWFETVLHRDITYDIPLRVTLEKKADPRSQSWGWLMQEDWNSLHTRVRRLDTEYAWAEDPRTRTRRFITNIRVGEAEGEGVSSVRSNILVYWARESSDEYKLLSGERHDIWVLNDAIWTLRQRRVLLDHTVLVTHNLSIFL